MTSLSDVPLASNEQSIARSLHLTEANGKGSISSVPVLPEKLNKDSILHTLPCYSEFPE